MVLIEIWHLQNHYCSLFVISYCSHIMHTIGVFCVLLASYTPYDIDHDSIGRTQQLRRDIPRLWTRLPYQNVCIALVAMFKRLTEQMVSSRYVFLNSASSSCHLLCTLTSFGLRKEATVTHSKYPTKTTALLIGFRTNARIWSTSVLQKMMRGLSVASSAYRNLKPRVIVSSDQRASQPSRNTKYIEESEPSGCVCVKSVCTLGLLTKVILSIGS